MPKLLRRSYVCLTLGSVLQISGLSRMAHAAPHMLPVATALDEDLARAIKQGKPLVVLVSLEGCPFCRVIRENFLPSLEREQQITVVQVDMRKSTETRDLQGRRTTHDLLTRAWGIKLAPTVLFFGKNGSEIAERLVGVAVPDFYGAYLQDRIDSATRSLKL
jgi:thioredoxin-related protein